MKFINFCQAAYAGFVKYINLLLPAPFLLLLRVFWGYDMFLDGWGKVHHMAGVIEYFGPGEGNLNLPFPAFNAYLTGYTEYICGLLLIAGLASRVAALGVTTMMTVAFLAEKEDNVRFFSVFKTPDQLIDLSEFTKAGPFPLLLVSLVIFVFGPGAFSIDWLLQKFIWSKRMKPGTAVGGK